MKEELLKKEEKCENLARFLKKDPEAYFLNENGEVRCRSVHSKVDHLREEKAKAEAKKDTVAVDEIINRVNEFFSMIGVKRVDNPKMSPKDINYSGIKKEYELDDEKDLIWMKFTKDGFLGVVAQSTDINFEMPASAADYHKRINGVWEHTTSGIIVHLLGKEWDDSFVLVFPIKSENKEFDRHDIETAIGNYLISKGIPILDYYSHNY